MLGLKTFNHYKPLDQERGKKLRSVLYTQLQSTFPNREQVSLHCNESSKTITSAYVAKREKILECFGLCQSAKAWVVSEDAGFQGWEHVTHYGAY